MQGKVTAINLTRSSQGFDKGLVDASEYGSEDEAVTHVADALAGEYGVPPVYLGTVLVRDGVPTLVNLEAHARALILQRQAEERALRRVPFSRL